MWALAQLLATIATCFFCYRLGWARGHACMAKWIMDHNVSMTLKLSPDGMKTLRHYAALKNIKIMEGK